MGIIIARIIVLALAFLSAAYIVPGIDIAGTGTAFILALLWGIIAITIRPVLFLLTLPINLVTFGLFSFFINAFFLWFLSSFVEGFGVASFGAALVGALVIALASWFGNKLVMAIAGQS